MGVVVNEESVEAIVSRIENLIQDNIRYCRCDECDVDFDEQVTNLSRKVVEIIADAPESPNVFLGVNLGSSKIAEAVSKMSIEEYGDFRNKIGLT